jgi:hypothetical protein
MSGKTSKKMTRGLQLSCGGPKCLSALSGISLRRVLASKEPIPSTRTSSGNLCQEGWWKSACPPGFRKSLFRRGEWPDTSTVYGLYTYQPTLDTFATVYSSFHWICVWPAKTFGGDCIKELLHMQYSQNIPVRNHWLLFLSAVLQEYVKLQNIFGNFDRASMPQHE